MRPEISLTCAGCGVTFQRRRSEVDRQRRNNPERQPFCTRSCYFRSEGHQNLGEHLGSRLVDGRGTGVPRDRWSPFRYFMRKARNRKQPTDLDLSYLEELWRAQDGRCALSGLQMEMPSTGEVWEKQFRDPFKPSLDRIDNRQGYVRGNVRFVCVIANLAKASFSDEELVTFCTAVATWHATPVASEPRSPVYRAGARALAA